MLYKPFRRLNVTVIQFPRAFWPKNCHAFSAHLTDNVSIPIFLNLYHYLGQPMLMGYHGGDRAKHIEKLTYTELAHVIMRELKKLFGDNIPEPQALISTRWSQNELSYGSYSYLPVGASADTYNAMASPIDNRLFFAGEATNAAYLATTHGAYLSGLREAERIKTLCK